MPSKVWDEITFPFPKFYGLVMDKQFHPTLHKGCDYLSMLGSKLYHSSSHQSIFEIKAMMSVDGIQSSITVCKVVIKYLDVHILQWRHNERHGVSNHLRLDFLLSRLSRCRSKKISKLCVTGLCEGNPPVVGGSPLQRASNTKNVSISLRHHVTRQWNALE